MALHLIKRILPSHASTNLKRQLYLSLVRSHLTYCSQLWRPRLIKDIEILERIQRRATKYIIGNNQMDYKCRLLSLHLLPLMPREEHYVNLSYLVVYSLFFILCYTAILINICYVFIAVSVLLLSITYLVTTFSLLTQFLHRLVVYICTFSYSFIGLVCQHSPLCIKTHDFYIIMPDAVKLT